MKALFIVPQMYLIPKKLCIIFLWNIFKVFQVFDYVHLWFMVPSFLIQPKFRFLVSDHVIAYLTSLKYI